MDVPPGCSCSRRGPRGRKAAPAAAAAAAAAELRWACLQSILVLDVTAVLQKFDGENKLLSAFCMLEYMYSYMCAVK
jgi:hypothetical protein